MNWLATLLGNSGEGVAKPIVALDSLIDNAFTSDDEKLQHAGAIEKLKAASLTMQAAQNMEATKSSFWFVAAARPFLVWASGFNFLQVSVAVVWFNKAIPEWWMDATVSTVLGSLGIYGLFRTAEKAIGKTK